MVVLTVTPMQILLEFAKKKHSADLYLFSNIIHFHMPNLSVQQCSQDQFQFQEGLHLTILATAKGICRQIKDDLA